MRTQRRRTMINGSPKISGAYFILEISEGIEYSFQYAEGKTASVTWREFVDSSYNKGYFDIREGEEEQVDIVYYTGGEHDYIVTDGSSAVSTDANIQYRFKYTIEGKESE